MRFSPELASADGRLIMREEPILEEVRRVRDEHAAKLDHDLQRIFADLKEQERRSVPDAFAEATRQAGPIASLTTQSSESLELPGTRLSTLNQGSW
jgi:hypothetical protein